MSQQQPSFLRIGRTQRGLITGQTGSGKTTLSRILVSGMRNLVVLDPKGEFQPGRQHRICRSPKDLSRRTDNCIVYRPAPEYLNVVDWDKVCKWIYQRGNTFVYIDEISLIAESAMQSPAYLRALYQQGRGLGIGILGATQRPYNIPLYCISECSKFWKFFLLMSKDRGRMAEYMGEEVDVEHSNRYSFFFYDLQERKPPTERVLNV